ncbi:MAD2 mitotic arrest deficient-like 2 [Mortierella sp. GBA30]|nr:MAD2 mitotic arrest deficient-like 2 [Mortierella sp. GBA30]
MILFVRGIYPPELFESTQKYNCPVKTARHPHLVSYIQQIIRSIRTELYKDTIHRICIVTLDPSANAIDRFVFEMSMLRSFEERLLNSTRTTGMPSHDSTSPNINNNNKNDDDEYRPKHQKLDKGKGRAVNGDQDNRPSTHLSVLRNDRIETGGTESLNDHVGAQEETEGDEGDEPLYRSMHHQRHRRAQQQSKEGPKLGSTIALTTDLEVLLRAMLLKMSVCDSYLPPLVPDCSFTVVIEMKTTGNGPEQKADFPWNPISSSSLQERSKLSASHESPEPRRTIIPVKTIDIADIQLELYIEQLRR